MRTVLILVGMLLVLVVGGLALAVTNVNGLLEENRERLTALASDAAGRTIDYERAQVAFAGGLAIEVSGLRIAEDARYGPGDFLALDSAFIGVEILPALSRRLEVRGVRLDQPRIRIVQTADGFNFSSLGATSASDAPAEPAPDEESAPLAAAIAAFGIRGGTIDYEDRTASPPRALVIEDFESSGSDLSLDGPIAIDFAGRVRPATGQPGLESRHLFLHLSEVGGADGGVGEARSRIAARWPLILNNPL